MFKDTGQMLVDWIPSTGAATSFRALDQPKPHTLSMQDFVTAAVEGTEPLVTGDQGLVTTTIVDALYRSAASGREVVIEP